MIDPKRHAENRNPLESVLRRIPGFQGYLEKEYRRQSDHLARTWLADRLQQGQRALDSAMRGLVDAGQIDRLPAWERVKNRLEGLILKIRGAVRGYSGFFDFVRVDEGLLEQVYEHDMSLMQDTEELVQRLEQLATKPDASETAPTRLLQQVESVERMFVKRGETLRGLGA
jgi:hypothetical protein